MADDFRQRVLQAARSMSGLTYSLDPPPDGVNTIDCSLLVLKSLGAVGIPLQGGVRTAEQIRQACPSIDWGDVAPADLLFFEHTYEPNEPAGPDGKVASHIGLSLGRGTFRMIDAHERVGPDVAETDISGGYWQEKLLPPRRPPGLLAVPAPGEKITGYALDTLHRIRFEGLGVGYNPLTGIAAFWREHPELGAAVSMEITLEDGRAAQAFAGGIIVSGPNGPRIL